MGQLLKVKEVAKIIGLSEERVREIAAAGNIKASKPVGSRRWIFTAQAVADYMGVKVNEL